MLAGLVVAAALSSAQEPRPSADGQSRRLSDRIRALERESERLAGEARSLLTELRRLEIARDLKIEQAKQAAVEAAEGERALRETTDRLASLELQRLAQLPDMKQQLVDVYKRGRSGYASLLFGAGDVREFARAARAVASLANVNRQRLDEHRRTLDALRKERASFAARARELKTRETAARQARAEAERAVAARATRMSEIDARRDLAAQYAGELQVAYDRIQQQLTAPAEGRPSDAVAVPLLPFRGALDWPTTGRISSRFGQTTGRLGGSAVNNGVEIASTEDLPVRAVHTGTVAYADAFTGLGTLIILDHGGNNYSLYGYLGSVAVAVGAMVETGAEIGRVGASPAGPAALYFEMRIDGKPTDPVQWLKPR